MRADLLKMYTDKSLYKYALKLTKDANQAEDLVHETIVRLLSSDVYRKDVLQRSYVFICLKSTFINNVNRSTKYREKLLVYSDKYCAKIQYNNGYERVFIEQIFNNVSNKDLLVYRSQKYTAKEIAKKYATTKNTVDGRIERMKLEIERFR